MIFVVSVILINSINFFGNIFNKVVVEVIIDVLMLVFFS